MSNRTVIKTGVTNILGDTVADVIIPINKLADGVSVNKLVNTVNAPQPSRVLDATDKRTKRILDTLSNRYTLSMTNYIYQRNRLLLNQLKKQLRDVGRLHNPVDKKKALTVINNQVKKFNYAVGMRKLLNDLWDSSWFAGAGEALEVVKRDKAAFAVCDINVVEFADDEYKRVRRKKNTVDDELDKVKKDKELARRTREQNQQVVKQQRKSDFERIERRVTKANAKLRNDEIRQLNNSNFNEQEYNQRVNEINARYEEKNRQDIRNVKLQVVQEQSRQRRDAIQYESELDVKEQQLQQVKQRQDAANQLRANKDSIAAERAVKNSKNANEFDNNLKQEQQRIDDEIYELETGKKRKRSGDTVKSDKPVKSKADKFADLPKDEQSRRKLTQAELDARRDSGNKPYVDNRRNNDVVTPVDTTAQQRTANEQLYKEQVRNNKRELKNSDSEINKLNTPTKYERDQAGNIQASNKEIDGSNEQIRLLNDRIANESDEDRRNKLIRQRDREIKARDISIAQRDSLINELDGRSRGRLKALEEAKVRRAKLIQQKANLEANARDKTPITQTDFGSAYISKRNGQISDNYEQAYQQQVTNLIAQYANGTITEQQLFDSLSGKTPYGTNDEGVAGGADSEAYKKVPHDVSKRVGRIARTEVVAAFNIGKLDKLYEQGYEEVEWCAVLETGTCSLCNERNGTIYRIDELLNQLDTGRFPSRSEKDNWEYIVIPAHSFCNCFWKPVGDMEEEERNRRRRKVNKQRTSTALKATAFAATGAISLGLIYAGLLAYRGKLKINKKSVQQIQEKVQAIQQKAVEKQVNIPLSTTISNTVNQVNQTTPESVKRAIAEQLLDIPKQIIQEQIPVDLRPTVDIPEPELDIVNQEQLNLVQEQVIRVSGNLEARTDEGATSIYEPDQNVIKTSGNLALRANKQIVIANNILSKDALAKINNMQVQALNIINLLSQSPNDVNTAMRGIELLKDMNDNYILAARTNDVALKHIQVNLALVRDELIAKLGEQYSIDVAPVNLDTKAILKATRPYTQIEASFDNAQRLRVAYNNELPDRLNILDGIKQRLIEVPAVKYLYKAEQRGRLGEFTDWLKSKDPVNKVSNRYQLNQHQNNILYIEDTIKSGVPIGKREYEEYMRQLYNINNDVIEKSKKYNVDVDFISNNIKRENLILEPKINPREVEQQLNTYRQYQQLYNEISNKTHDLTIRMKDMKVDGNFKASWSRGINTMGDLAEFATRKGRKRGSKNKNKSLSLRNHILTGIASGSVIGTVPGIITGSTLGHGMGIRGALVGASQGAVLGALKGSAIYGVRRAWSDKKKR